MIVVDGTDWLAQFVVVLDSWDVFGCIRLDAQPQAPAHDPILRLNQLFVISYL